MAPTSAAPSDGSETIERLRALTSTRSSRELAHAILELVGRGELTPGDRLPTVRHVAARLGMSPAAVGVAWRQLADLHVIETRRRGGTVILGQPVAPRASRFDSMMRASTGLARDLGNLTADASILPPLREAVLSAISAPEFNAPFESPISSRLREAVSAGWPFPASYFLATHGGVDAAELALRTSVGPGDRVIVETPGLSRVLDVIESIGAQPIGIEPGPDGPRLDQLAHALADRPSAFIYQPLGSIPSGRSVTHEWRDRAAELLAGSRIPVIELVQAPLLHDDAGASLGTLLPQSVVHVRSFNFAFGNDLRVAVVGGGDYYVDRMWLRLTYSSRWVSRLLQDTLAFQLADPRAATAVRTFVETCRSRTAAMIAALRAEGFDLPDVNGPSLWIPVDDERATTAQLARKGISVHLGSYFEARHDSSQHHVLMNPTVIADGHAELARLFAEAAARPARS
jgi:DNA-binding transcriptional MocR family regulator